MRFIIVGCGRMGSRLAQQLAREGHAVAAVDIDPQALRALGANFTGKVIEGVGFDRDVLLKAGIQQADGLAAVTHSDEVNVVVARLARQVFKVPRVIARIYDPAKAEIYRRLGLTTVAPVVWATRRFAQLLSSPGVESTATLGNGGVEIVEMELPPLLLGRTSKDLVLPGELHLVAFQRSGKTMLPSNGLTFKEGDRLFLAVAAGSENRLKALLGQ